MPAPLSVIIPTRNSAQLLPPTLVALMEGLHAGLIHELVVVDAGSDDETCAVARAMGAVVLDWRPGGAEQMKSGRAAAKAAWHLILIPGAVLAPGWADAASAFITKHPNALGYFAIEGPGIRTAWQNFAARFLGRPNPHQGALMRRDLPDPASGRALSPIPVGARVRQHRLT